MTLAEAHIVNGRFYRRVSIYTIEEIKNNPSLVVLYKEEVEASKILEEYNNKHSFLQFTQDEK